MSFSHTDPSEPEVDDGSDEGQTCPNCESTDTHHFHVMSPPAQIETWYWQCNDCWTQWGHE